MFLLIFLILNLNFYDQYGYVQSIHDQIWVYEQQYFLQALEGERSAVNELYLDIADDPRHDEITIISYEEITAPIFKQWKMGYAGGSAEFTKLLKEMGQTEFLPETMSPRQAFQFLQHLAGNQDNL